MHPFLTKNAAVHGYTPAMVRGTRFVRPAHGVTMPSSEQRDLRARCQAIGLVLPDDAVFTHLTSAQLRGWWLPPVSLPLLIACSDDESPHHDRRGVYVRRCGIPPKHRQILDGLPVASPTWTITELAEHLSLIDLVCVIDSAIHAGDLTIEELPNALIRGRRGVRVLRRAVDLVDAHSESPWESILRLLHELSGVPVDTQVLIADDHGVVIARSDLRIRGTRRLPEYDGSDHRDREQHQRDLMREKALARLNWERYGYIAQEILRDPARIIRDADEALGRPHDPSRLDTWRHEVDASSLSAAGAAALNRRLQRFVRSGSPRPVRQE